MRNLAALILLAIGWGGMAVAAPPVSPPAGKQLVTLTSISGTSFCAEFNAVASPDIAVGDVLVIDLATDPDDFDVTVGADCDLHYSGTSARQLITYEVFDLSADAYMAGGPGNLWFNNLTPSPPEPDSIVFRWTSGTPITPVDLSTYCTDAESDAITVTEVSGLAAGLSITNSIVSGTPTTPGISTLVLRCTDIAGASVDWQ